MEKRIMKILSIALTVVAVLCVGVFLGVDNMHYKSEVLAKEIEESRQIKQSIADRMRDEIANANELASFADKGQIRIAVPQGTTADMIQYSENILDRFYQVVIPGVDDAYFDSNPIMGSVGNINDFSAYEAGGKAYYDITLNGVYDARTTLEGGYLYLDFENPHKVYDHVVVIDAGHGGKDVGAVEGNCYEKTIDLDIVLKLKQLIDADPRIKAYYTRLNDTNPSLDERVRLANDVNADVFLSVHNNSLSGFGAKMTSGTQVLYYASDPTGLSGRFADICLNAICDTLQSTNRGLVNGDDIYIIHNSKSPVALVEVGFLSNPQDLMKLNQEQYQQRCAEALYASIREMLDKTYTE